LSPSSDTLEPSSPSPRGSPLVQFGPRHSSFYSESPSRMSDSEMDWSSSSPKSLPPSSPLQSGRSKSLGPTLPKNKDMGQLRKTGKGPAPRGTSSSEIPKPSSDAFDLRRSSVILKPPTRTHTEKESGSSAKSLLIPPGKKLSHSEKRKLKEEEERLRKQEELRVKDETAMKRLEETHKTKAEVLKVKAGKSKLRHTKACRYRQQHSMAPPGEDKCAACKAAGYKSRDHRGEGPDTGTFLSMTNQKSLNKKQRLSRPPSPGESPTRKGPKGSGPLDMTSTESPHGRRLPASPPRRGSSLSPNASRPSTGLPAPSRRLEKEVVSGDGLLTVASITRTPITKQHNESTRSSPTTSRKESGTEAIHTSTDKRKSSSRMHKEK